MKTKQVAHALHVLAEQMELRACELERLRDDQFEELTAVANKIAVIFEQARRTFDETFAV
jgi:hypothetical protein